MSLIKSIPALPTPTATDDLELVVTGLVIMPVIKSRSFIR